MSTRTKTQSQRPRPAPTKRTRAPSKVTASADGLERRKPATSISAVDSVQKPGTKKRKVPAEPLETGAVKKRKKSDGDAVIRSGGRNETSLGKVASSKHAATGHAAMATSSPLRNSKMTTSAPPAAFPSVQDGPSKRTTRSAPNTSKQQPAVNDAESDEDDEAAGADEGDELHGFSSGSDSSDEDDDGVDAQPVDVGKLPTIAKDDETVRRRLQKAKKIQNEDRGVVYLGRIPHGFYEDQMRGYFSQFGEVTRLRLSRNKKTGRSKHYAFIEFDSAAVAEIVADTMDNYLLLGHILQCKLIPTEEVHPELWVGANRKWRKIPLQRVTRLKHNKERTVEQEARSNQRLLKRQEEKKRKLAAAGIDYDMDAVGFKQTPVEA